MLLESDIQNLVTGFISPEDLENDIISRYVAHEKAGFLKCPLCELFAVGYVELNYHIAHEHTTSEISEGYEKLKYVINPILELRELEYNRYSEPSEKLMTIGKFFGEIITSVHNQNALVNIIGKQGTGKSNAALWIAKSVSEYVAAKIGGKPEDYFTMENVAIMRLETILPILKNIDKKRFNIFVFDDIGGEWGARDSQKTQNKEVNKIIQTFRDSNTLCIFTVPDLFLMDKVGRKLAHYQIEMSYTMFERGLSVGKIKTVLESYQTGKTYLIFPVIANAQYKRIMFERVPKEMADAYEARRVKIRRKYTEESVQKMSGEDTSNPLPKERAFMAILGPVQEQLNIDVHMPIRKISRNIGKSFYTTNQAVKFLRGESV
jgi:hypothetical protein